MKSNASTLIFLSRTYWMSKPIKAITFGVVQPSATTWILLGIANIEIYKK
jgi:hypothetical protein